MTALTLLSEIYIKNSKPIKMFTTDVTSTFYIYLLICGIDKNDDYGEKVYY